jgi:hypothetical protein
LILDEAEYPAEKLERLLATKGLPERFSLQWGYRQLRATLSESGASVFLFLAAAAAGLVLALLGWIDRGRSIAFCLGYVVYLIAVPLWMAAHQRFPQRVSLSLYTVAALGLFIYLARELGDRSPDREIVRNRRHDASALGIVGVCLLGWAVNLAMWLHPPPPPHRDALQAFEDRVAARNGFVFVYVQSGLVDLDPLRARPRGYDALQGGWGTFSTLWYQSIERLGVHRGADVLRAMVDNPDAYLVSWMGARGGLEDWIRRKLGNPAARLALLDGPEFFGPGRPELFRVVTTPLVRGSDEWTLLAREELALGDLLPSAPDVSGLTFHPIAFSAPYEQYASTIEHPATSIRLAPVGNGLGCAVASDPDTSCTVTGEDSEYAGVHVPVDGLGAARFQLRLIDPENIVAFSVYAQTTTSRSIRWIWQLSEVSQQFGWSGTFTLVPRYPAGHLELAVNTARPRDIRELRFFIVVKPGTNAGFELTSLEIAPP